MKTYIAKKGFLATLWNGDRESFDKIREYVDGARLRGGILIISTRCGDISIPKGYYVISDNAGGVYGLPSCVFDRAFEEVK